MSNEPVDAGGRAAAYAELVSAVLDLRRSDPTRAFDTVVSEAVADGRLTEELARELKWLQRQSLRELVAHAEHVLPATLMALEGSADDTVSTSDDPVAEPVAEPAPAIAAVPAAVPPTSPPPAPPPALPVDEQTATTPEPTPPVDLTQRRLLVAGLRPIDQPPFP